MRQVQGPEWFKGFMERHHYYTVHELVKCLLITVGIIVRPFFMTGGTLWIWYDFVWKKNIHLPKQDEGVLAIAITAFLVPLFAIILGYVLTTMWDRTRELECAELRRDMDSFLEKRDYAIPIHLHALLFVLALEALFVPAFLDYSEAASGFMVMGIVSFTVSVCWTVGRIFEHPLVLMKRRLPKEWIEADPRKHFAEKTRQAPQE